MLEKQVAIQTHAFAVDEMDSDVQKIIEEISSQTTIFETGCKGDQGYEFEPVRLIVFDDNIQFLDHSHTIFFHPSFPACVIQYHMRRDDGLRILHCMRHQDIEGQLKPAFRE